MSPIGTLIILMFCYFLPTFVARKGDRPMVLVINFFLGWTLIGWVIALAIAARPKGELK